MSYQLMRGLWFVGVGVTLALVGGVILYVGGWLGGAAESTPASELPSHIESTDDDAVPHDD